jgi:hypothetical protein
MSINELSELWRAVFRTETPNQQQWIVWTNLHDADIVREGLLQLAVKHRKAGGTMTQDHMIRFASAVMNRLRIERRSALAKLQDTHKENKN